jgi:RHS repeat-associated protein
MNLTGTSYSANFERGKKLFELSNHLGNVLVTVTDRRQQSSAAGVNVDYYQADVAGANDYYPFGMQMPGRKYSVSSAYRYGFNGKELDKELMGTTTYDYGFRIYNPGIARFLSVDPLSGSFPFYTPYQFAGNKPVWCIDLDGLEEVLPKQQPQIPQLRNVSESTCQGCAERSMRMRMLQDQADLDKLKKEYEVWRINNPIGTPVPPQYQAVVPKFPTNTATIQQGGYLGSNEYKLAKANYDTYGKYLPGLSDLEDGVNLANELKNGNYKMAAMYGLFLLPGGDFAKPAKGFITKLAADGAEYALKNVSRLQHAFKHAGDIKQFAGKNWNNEIKEAWKNFNSDILQTATKSFDNVLGKDKVKGFYKNVDGQDIATYIYKEGDKAGEIATTVVLTPNQMTKFGLK